MNRGLLLKALRESWLTTLSFGIGLALAEAGLSYAYLKFQDEISEVIAQVYFVQQFVNALLDSDRVGPISPEMLSALAWVHPVMLALVWAHAILCCTRVPAGEVDRGTLDVLLGLPVSRWQLYCAETAVWLASGMVVLLLGTAGNTLGSWLLSGRAQIGPGRLAGTRQPVLPLCCGRRGCLVRIGAQRPSRPGRGCDLRLRAWIVSAGFPREFLEPGGATRVSQPASLLPAAPGAPWRDVAAARNERAAGVRGCNLDGGGLIFARRDLSTL